MTTWPMAHNTEGSGPDGFVPVIIEAPTPSHPSDPENWHESSDDEYALYLAYWNHVHDTHDGEPPCLPCCAEVIA